MLRRRPTGLTLEILKLLFELGPLPSAIIAERLNVPSRHVASYLSSLKRRGVVAYVDGMWMLTEDGCRYMELLTGRKGRCGGGGG